ncbi:MAG: Gfo/Idh/MocA family oxidoreductase [Vicinamibacterales bacterium]
MPAALRVALIGYGHAGAVFHGPLIAATTGARLAAIVTADPARRAQAAAAHPEARLLPDADALWGIAADLDLVVIATPNRTHVPLALAAIDAGLAVVVDKPIAARASDAQALIDAAQRAGTPLTVFQNRRWDGDFLTVQRLLAEGSLGRIARFESRYERWRPAVKTAWRMHDAPDEAGGLLFDLGAHVIDEALHLFGPAESVYAQLDSRRPGVTVDDDSFVAVTHASGVRSHLWMSSVAAQTGPRFRLLGSAGAFVKYGLDVQEDALRSGLDPRSPGWGVEPPDKWGRLGIGDDTRLVSTEPGAYLQFYTALVTALRRGGAMPVDPRDSVASLVVIEAAQRSHASSVVVRLDA